MTAYDCIGSVHMIVHFIIPWGHGRWFCELQWSNTTDFGRSNDNDTMV